MDEIPLTDIDLSLLPLSTLKSTVLPALAEADAKSGKLAAQYRSAVEAALGARAETGQALASRAAAQRSLPAPSSVAVINVWVVYPAVRGAELSLQRLDVGNTAPRPG
jgi:hypothetical protein